MTEKLLHRSPRGDSRPLNRGRGYTNALEDQTATCCHLEHSAIKPELTMASTKRLSFKAFGLGEGCAFQLPRDVCDAKASVRPGCLWWAFMASSLEASYTISGLIVTHHTWVTQIYHILLTNQLTDSMAHLRSHLPSKKNGSTWVISNSRWPNHAKLCTRATGTISMASVSIFELRISRL